MRPIENSGEFRGLSKLFGKGIDLRSILYSKDTMKIDPAEIEVSARNLLPWAGTLLIDPDSRQDEFLTAIFNNHN